jgi:hypothetical protein
MSITPMFFYVISLLIRTRMKSHIMVVEYDLLKGFENSIPALNIVLSKMFSLEIIIF